MAEQDCGRCLVILARDDHDGIAIAVRNWLRLPGYRRKTALWNCHNAHNVWHCGVQDFVSAMQNYDPLGLICVVCQTIDRGSRERTVDVQFNPAAWICA